MMQDLNNINDIIRDEGLTLLVVSYGGCCSNTLCDILEKNDYKCRTNTYTDILCHCPHYIDVDIPIIYIYDNPIKSFLSMKNRGLGFWGVNQQKMSNNKNIDLSDETLITLMINQFNSWTQVKRKNVLVIRSCELFEDNIVNKLEFFLNKKMHNFPILYTLPKTDMKNIKDKKINKLFTKYNLELLKIINWHLNC